MDCDFTPISKKQTWAPEFQDQTRHLYLIDGFEPIQECPVSAISAEAREAVIQFERIEFATENTHTAWQGPTLADWPPDAVELSIALASETNRLANAKARSETAHSGRPKQVVAEETGE